MSYGRSGSLICFWQNGNFLTETHANLRWVLANRAHMLYSITFYWTELNKIAFGHAFRSVALKTEAPKICRTVELSLTFNRISPWKTLLRAFRLHSFRTIEATSLETLMPAHSSIAHGKCSFAQALPSLDFSVCNDLNRNTFLFSISRQARTVCEKEKDKCIDWFRKNSIMSV